ncbi:uncharacterized protein LOC124406385 [Diprion similis]|uniref:uncharacterized protein LOC124406385 n=1 Tax=Diprion similis TaxID=362088 RepID=UPI001EF754A5|nr:uncharacterized protein LOC124406385 [Diprion similis]
MDRKKGSRETRSSENERKSRPKKRKGVFNPNLAESESGSFSTSAKKLKDNIDMTVNESPNIEYRILNFWVVFAAISSLVKCKTCNGNITFETANARGLGFKVVVKCDSCADNLIPSSPFVAHSYEINRRFIFTMRVLGIGLAGAQKFCGLMDMPRFLTETTYSLILKSIYESVKTCADVIFKKAVREEIKDTPNAADEATPQLTVSGYGSWRKRGYTSLFGVTSVIGYYSGKVLDLVVKSVYCKMCESWKHKVNDAEYEEWYQTHGDNCSANHEGSSGKMEVDSIIEIFKRSIEKYNVLYSYYIGDGDSKTYTGLVNSHPYDDVEVIKKECIGHVQKRMGSRLRNIVKKNKKLGGKGQLTGKFIDKLTVYYGLAIRRHSASVHDMHEAIWATFDHYSSTDANPHHERCPTGEESWCSYQRAQARNEAFQHDYKPLPSNVLDAIRPVYNDLSKETLLERCVGGFDQNNNESFNQLIWKISPKIVSSGAVVVNLAAYIAAGLFNEGSKSLLFYLNSIGVSCGRNAHEYADKMDEARIALAERRAAESTREGRMLRRQYQISLLQAASSAEELLYGPGIDDSI